MSPAFIGVTVSAPSDMLNLDIFSFEMLAVSFRTIFIECVLGSISDETCPSTSKPVMSALTFGYDMSLLIRQDEFDIITDSRSMYLDNFMKKSCISSCFSLDGAVL